MTVRVRRPSGGIRTRLGRMFEGEERQSALVTWGFIAAIVAVVAILLGSIALAWYNDNIRAVARVGSSELGPQQLRDIAGFEQWRIQREQGRVTEAQIRGEIDSETAQARLSELSQRSDAIPTTALETLIDAVFQSQLAAEQGITVTDADVDQALTDEMAGVERRHSHVIAIEPEAADEETGPTNTERAAALAKAEEALAELEGGADFADVAREYSTDPTAPNGGDMGVLSLLAVSDTELARQLFDLEEGGTTGVIAGSDGMYRIGHVSEIQEAAEEPGARASLFGDVPEAGVRQLLRYEVAADRLDDKITGEALAATPEQARIAVIYVEGLLSGDPEDQEGEVDYSEIVFAPDDDVIAAPDLDENDPLWAEAETGARNTFEELNAITDPAIRATRFEELAAQVSDGPTAEDGGRQGFTTLSIAPPAVGPALFDTEHAENDLIGPIKGEAGWYVLLFHERRDSPEQRIQAVRDALAAPGANFNDVARELSEGPEAADGGEIGWLTRDQMAEDLVEIVFGLEVSGVSEPQELGEGNYFIKLEEKGPRALDADQIPSIRRSAFSNWYTPKKEEAEANGVIVRAGETPTDDEELDPDLEQP